MKTFRKYIPVLGIISIAAVIVCSSGPSEKLHLKQGRVVESPLPEEGKKIESAYTPAPVVPPLPIGSDRNRYLPEEDYTALVGYNQTGYSSKNNLFIINLPNLPSDNEKVYLEYDLFGMRDFSCIPHSINDNLATGGFFKAVDKQWNSQREQIPAHILKEGENLIRFTAPQTEDFRYMVKNLSIKFEKQDEAKRQLVVNQPSTACYYENYGYVQGFVAGDQSLQAIVTISGTPVTTRHGMFEKLVRKPDDRQAGWSAMIVATFPDGQVLQTTVNFDKPVDCEIIMEATPSYNYEECFAGDEGGFDLQLKAICLQAADGATKPGTKITAIELRSIDFPLMDPGMVNVMKDNGGYRCLPHKSVFSSDIRISLEYEPGLLPSGYTPNDVFTFFFDESIRKWVVLPRDSVDLANNCIISRTNHFTDFINGIIKVPESPLTQAYTPTSIKDIKAANPLEAMGVIEPPKANNMGTANLSYPLVIPQGRKGMQPNLTLQYSSSNNNGWMGLGWNIAIPAINVETRWGVPRYSAAWETEIYCINGEQVMMRDENHDPVPLPNRDDSTCRVDGDVNFYPRVEGNFDSIIRHGKNPKYYWWEVIDRNGVSYFYGKDFDEDTVNFGAVLRDTNGNIAFWGLTEIRDLHENCVRYYYETVYDAGFPDGTVLGKQLYIKHINYTGFDTHLGEYSVFFQRYVQNVNTYRRKDVIINARYGFKEVTAELLRQVIIAYRSDTIRRYYFGYEEGPFGKSLLCGFQEIDEEIDTSFDNTDYYHIPSNICNEFGGRTSSIKVHRFSYYNDYQSALASGGLFTDDVTITTPNDNVSMLGKSSAIDASHTVQSGFSGMVGVGCDLIPHLKTLSVTGQYAYTDSRTKGSQVSMVDLNADGLPDKVYAVNDQIYYRKLLQNTNGTYSFGDEVSLSGPGRFLYNESYTNSISVNATATDILKGNYNHSLTKSYTSDYFADVNADGLIDIVTDQGVYFNTLNSTGDPQFDKATTDTIYTAGLSCNYTLFEGGVDDSVGIYNTIDPTLSLDTIIHYDAVRMWRAPFDGNISVDATIALVEDTTRARRNARHTDGVRFTIQHEATELVDDTISASNYTPKTPDGLNSVDVNAGDRMFFRLQSVNTRSFDVVHWEPVITYSAYTNQEDANELGNYQFDSRRDFILDQEQLIAFPVDGSAKINGRLVMPEQSDSMWVKIFQNSTCFYNYCYPGNSSVNDSLDLTLQHVDSGDVFRFVLYANTNIDWSAIKFDFNIHLNSVDDTAYTAINFDGTRNFEYNPVWAHNLFSCPLFVTRPYTFNAGTIQVIPDLSFSSGTANGNIVFSIKSTRELLAKRKLNIVNGSIVNGSALSVSVADNQKIYFEFFCEDTVLSPLVTDAQATVSSTPYDAGFHAAFPPMIKRFGPLYRGWGAFTYNDNPDTPIDTSKLIYEQGMFDNTELESEPDTITFSSFVDDLDNLYNPLKAPFIKMEANQKRHAYTSFNEMTSVGDTGQRNYPFLDNIPLFDDPIPIASVLNQEIKTVMRSCVSKSDSWGWGYSIPGSGLISKSRNKTNGFTESMMEYFDINGDRYPDFIGPEYAQITTMTGGISDFLLPHGQMVGRSSRQDMTSVGISIGAGFNGPKKAVSTNPSNTGQNPSLQGNSGTTSAGTGSGGSTSSGGNNASGGNQGGTVSSGGGSGKYYQNGVACSFNYGEGWDHSSYTWQDVNGDGLPDKIKDSEKVYLNTGYGFLPEENWEKTSPGGYSNTNAATIGGGQEYESKAKNKCNSSWSGGYSYSWSNNRLTQSTVDINGDGLLDICESPDDADMSSVYFNTGNQYLTAPVALLGSEPFNKGSTYSHDLSLNGTYGVSFLIIVVPVKLIFGAGGFISYNHNVERGRLVDMNADGYPDYVTSSDDSEIKVRYSKIGRTNMLKSYENFLGGKIEIDYALSGGGFDMPQRQWTMSSVKVYDGFEEDGPGFSHYTFQYDSGYYSRHERQSFGFRIVTTNTHDSTQNSNIYRSAIAKYHNNSYVFKDLCNYELSKNADGDKYIESRYKYVLKEISTGLEIPETNPECYDEGFPAIAQIDRYYWEGTSSDTIHTRERFEHGTYGNIKKYYQDGDLAILDDNLTSEITYHTDQQGVHIISLPLQIQVKQGAALYRRRETQINYATGDITRITMYNQSLTSEYNIDYDEFGNIKRLAYPENLNGERMVYYYDYDPYTYTYITEISDTLGYSSSAEYDLLFGKPIWTIDRSGQPCYYEYDGRGRLASITGPRELSASLPYTIKFEYWDKYGGIHYLNRQDSIPWARTCHYDPDNPSNDIITILLSDAHGKILQTKKDIALYDSASGTATENMVVSGRIRYDEYARPIKSYYPVIEALGTDSIFNFEYDTVPPTLTDYDILDRVVSQVLPDGATSTMEYGFGDDPFSEKRFLITQTDAIGITTYSFKDPFDHVTAIHAPYNTWTTFEYDPLGQLKQSTDPEDNVTAYCYDMLGRLIQRKHPDAGATTAEYDPAGNIISSKTQVHDSLGVEITYYYTFNQLDSIRYPLNPENNVHFEYGSPYSGNQAGRIIRQEDVNGVQEFTYDELGNMLTNLKTMIVPFDSIYTFLTKTTFDTWNRIDTIFYPDGEFVKYHYDAGGRFFNLHGEKDNDSYEYVIQTGYDKFENRIFLEYSNNSRSYYQYDSRRLHVNRLISISGDDHLMMNNTYYYDAVDNITGIVSNTDPHNNNIGGSVSKQYKYDSLYRLISSIDTSVVSAGTYIAIDTLSYHPSGKIDNKTQLVTHNGNSVQNLTYNIDYLYQTFQPHAPVSIGDEDWVYDYNGNVTKINNPVTLENRFHMWDDENRMKFAINQNQLGYYLYDAKGERTLKIKGEYSVMEINHETIWNAYISNYQTLYINPYIVVNNREYTKHYYIESQRIVSKIGGGFPEETDFFDWVWGFDVNSQQDYDSKMTLNEQMVLDDLDSCGQPGTFVMSSGLYSFLSLQNHRDDPETDVYFFHPDHLGSTSYITAFDGTPYQHVDYLPFGEVLLEEKADTWLSPYKFNCKELDEESGLYYYGARYYDPRSSVFLGVDPMSDKYPGISPFAYCANNPIKLIDPTGMSFKPYLIFDGRSGMLQIFDDNETPDDYCDDIFISQFPAHNNVDSKSKGKWEDGMYEMEDKTARYTHGCDSDYKGIVKDSEDGSYGEEGIYRAKDFKETESGKSRKGMAVHAGRENKPFLKRVTYGCIRTTRQAMKTIDFAIQKYGPLQKIVIKNNKESDNTPKSLEANPPF
ncbi:MAG TPA: SpvB/TcaC N-terminal domain-containing protein [Bacteroidales bacterium]|nr:SpvB/TcaC N-terminal domain-containing protein [Bacteroidales bacterium]